MVGSWSVTVAGGSTFASSSAITSLRAVGFSFGSTDVSSIDPTTSPADLRARRRGSARSLSDSPTSVMPSTMSTMAMPGNTAVHQMPAVTSETERFRS